ncbi:C1 family peptidase [candidate division WOR-3 bacterium]|nr:C1 family peptidase [candidate division WOR-3 bacterium]
MAFSKNLVLMFLLFAVSPILSALPQSDKGLTEEVIREIRKSAHLTPSERAIMNALTNNELSELALNRELLMQHNDLFNHKIDTKGITDQEKSGRCWLFAGLNMLRARVIKKYKLNDFEFSENYLFFWDKMEKANFFLESIIGNAGRDLLDRELEMLLKRPIGDGGLWSYVVDLIEKYGVIPKNAMPETNSSTHSWVMNKIISGKLREDATILRKMAENGATEETLEKKKIEMLKVIYKMLVLNLGEPPSCFIWRYEDKEGTISLPERYTSKEFYKKVVNVDLKDYVCLMNYPGKEYDRLLQFDQSRNIYEQADPTYANLDIEKIKALTLKSLLDDEPVWFACDIIKDGDFERGILLPGIIDYRSVYGIDIGMSKKERISYRESTGNHAMVFTGVDIQGGKPVKWLVEDSHGKERGHEGHWTMYDDWFNEYLYVAIINKRYLPGEIKDILEQEPMHLPPWDPLIVMLKRTI